MKMVASVVTALVTASRVRISGCEPGVRTSSANLLPVRICERVLLLRTSLRTKDLTILRVTAELAEVW